DNSLFTQPFLSNVTCYISRSDTLLPVDCGVKDDGAKALLEALRSNPPLHHLNLDSIPPPPLPHLLPTLSRSNTIDHIYIQCISNLTQGLMMDPGNEIALNLLEEILAQLKANAEIPPRDDETGSPPSH